MREVAKSMLGFSWAVSMFGAQQVGRMFGGGSTPAEETAAETDAVSKVIQEHLAGTQASLFRTGDEWQRRVVDAMFDAGATVMRPFRPGAALDPREIVKADPREMVESSMAAIKRSVDGVKKTVDDMTRNVSAPAAPPAAPVSTES
jgi:hypothetical protein